MRTSQCSNCRGGGAAERECIIAYRFKVVNVGFVTKRLRQRWIWTLNVKSQSTNHIPKWILMLRLRVCERIKSFWLFVYCVQWHRLSNELMFVLLFASTDLLFVLFLAFAADPISFEIFSCEKSEKFQNSLDKYIEHGVCRLWSRCCDLCYISRARSLATFNCRTFQRNMSIECDNQNKLVIIIWQSNARDIGIQFN